MDNLLQLSVGPQLLLPHPTEGIPSIHLLPRSLSGIWLCAAYGFSDNNRVCLDSCGTEDRGQPRIQLRHIKVSHWVCFSNFVSSVDRLISLAAVLCVVAR